jgi:amino acid transporter
VAQANLSRTASAARSGGEVHGSRRLGSFLCWAVVFADIGTSVYYTPGILYGQVGRLAGIFVTMTLFVFLLLTLKYAEVSTRFPEGGGVVTVAARGLNPWVGAVGGMFILVDYFLTSSISSLSGIQYFTDVIPRLAPIVLPVTVLVVTLLGVLNWWGIKESATVSAVIAVAAFASDIVIIVVVMLKVPLRTIGMVVHVILSGQHMTLPVVLTGFAGAFLAFSGLESISQLSPVMRLPRKRTVDMALALVVVTVGVTSPLLTIFSTTLLNASTVDPNKFISQLAGAYGGDVLKIATAITASALLVFASNTAIIGAYHVFLALSRMRFFPEAVERTNKLRGTPHVSIALATGIPMGILILVRGRIDLLGDMYAFGLLGAFSLTCLALDVIRYRERHGHAHVGALEEAEAHEMHAMAHDAGKTKAGSAAWEWLATRANVWLSEQTSARLCAMRQAAAQRWQALMVATAPSRGALEQAFDRFWPDAKYYLGFLTTGLVGLAWLINLKAKPLATEFGGGLTVLGVGIAIVHYHYQQRRGEAPVHLPLRLLFPIPGAILVVLPSEDPDNGTVIRTAVEAAGRHPLVFLCLGPQPRQPVELLQFADPYLGDRAAQRTLSLARNLAERAKVPAYFVYRVRGPQTVSDVWRIIQPDELLATVDVAHETAREIAPEYVRKQVTHGVTVEHRVRKHRPQMQETTTSLSPRAPIASPSGANGQRSQGASSMREQDVEQGTATGTQERAAHEAKGEATPDPTIEDWYWTGTDLIRKKRDPQPKDEP